MYLRLFCFFFQAEDGIRDYKVTGVQTCALPISSAPPLSFLTVLMIRVLQKFNSADISPAEYAGLSLMGIGLAAGLAFSNSHIDIPRGLHIFAWILVAVFLLLALIRSLSKALTSNNWPSLLFAALLR